MRTILHVVDTSAPPSAVYEALTTEKGLAGWWTTTVTAAPEVGAVVRFTFLEGFNPAMEVTGLDPDALVTWRCVGGAEPWADNTFRFEIAPLDDGRTRLRFRQDYAAELDDDMYGTFNFNWAYYLESLRLLLEEGRGKPFRPAT